MNSLQLKTIFSISSLVLFFATTAWSQGITDFTNWTQVEDPPNGNLSGFANSSSATLIADGGPIPVGVDIGYQSVNGNTADLSTAGYIFSADEDFEIAIDFDLSFDNASGGLGIGIGIGEQGTGENSAGVGLLTASGIPLLFSGAARDDDSSLASPLGLPATNSGSFFVSYDQATGDVGFGVSSTKMAAAPDASGSFSGVDLDTWQGDDLLVSFFMRSQDIPIPVTPGWQGGTATGVFTNFRVLSGSPVSVPEPSGGAILASIAGISVLRRKKRSA